MLRITDRYLLREIIPPFALGLLVFTFLLMIPTIMDHAEDLIAKGVDSVTIARIVVTLIPSGLGLTIPIALLLGILMGLGRLSTDRESVALQACGISLYRMLYPVALLAVVASLATGYVLIVALPDANQAFQEITFRVLANRAAGEVRARVFDDDYFPGVVLYVREVSTSGAEWSEVFLADLRDSVQPDVYVAGSGRVLLDREARRVEIVLTEGTGHLVNPSEPETYEVHDFDEMVLQVDAEAVFPRSGPSRGLRELTIPQLRDEANRMAGLGISAHQPIMEIHQKFSIPVACLVFALIALALGVTSRKDGKLASFALGIGVVFAYYVLMYGSRAMAMAGLVSPHLAMWIPNVVLGAFGVCLLVWRSSSVERRITIPFVTRGAPPAQAGTNGDPSSDEETANVLIKSLRAPRVGHLLDWYVTRVYLGTALLCFVGLLGIFYISTFIDLSDKLFKGQTTGLGLLEYFWYATPQFIYYVLPISALVASLVTVGLLTKSSELTVMKACGISLYRAALPIFLISLVWSGVLFGMSETILARANRHAEALNQEIRSGVARTADVMHRRWVVGETGSIYHYLSFDPELDEFGNLSVYDFSEVPWTLERRTYVTHAAFDLAAGEWEGHDTWVRDFTSGSKDDKVLLRADARPLPFLEPPDFFETEPPDAELMSYRELDTHLQELSASGFDVVELAVELHRKVSFPFVTLILTLIAVPFAVTMGPRGALYGVGVGITIACTYWIILSVFGAIGSAGLLGPMLAAWAPNLLFGASATYLLLTVRT